jgi:hypothetical protein
MGDILAVYSIHLDSVERREAFNRDRMNGGLELGQRNLHSCQVPQWYCLSARDWIAGRYIAGLPVIFTLQELVFWK